MATPMHILSTDNFDSFVFDSIIYTKMQLPEDDSSLLDKFNGGYSKRLYCPFCSDISIFKYSDLQLAKFKVLLVDLDHQKINHENATSAPGKLRGTLINNPDIEPSNKNITSLMHSLDYVCTSNPNHILNFYFHIEGNTITKIGQYPKTAVLKYPKRNRYDKLLKQYADEYKTSLQEASSGVGIGSFVYLRRIIEFLVEEIHQQLTTKPDWDEEAYKKLDFKDKMELCNLHEQFMPSELLPYRGLIYSVLSKGVHSLEEDECIALFPSLQVIIERILEHQLDRKKSDDTFGEAIKKINAYNSIN